MKPKLLKSKLNILFIMELTLLFVLLPACDPLLTQGSCPAVKEYFLRADVTTQTMPDGSVVTMWGYAQDAAFGSMEGAVKVPGPEINLQSCTQAVVIHLDNNLPEPTSIIINGLQAQMAPPVRYPDGRVRSFTKEAAPGNTEPVDYAWLITKPGTYLYQSGTHPSVQVQMGLYGAFISQAGDKLVYPDQAYDQENLFLISEIDPAIHQAVAAGDFGAGKTITSAVDYSPQYLLMNGRPYRSTDPVPQWKVGQRQLVRFINAGLKTHAPMSLGAYMTVLAEDANPYTYPKQLASALLPAGKTLDVIVTPAFPGQFSVIDRMLYLSNGSGKLIFGRAMVTP